MGASYFQFTSEDISVALIWVHSHIGIQGNERVDRLAKEASRPGFSDLNTYFKTWEIRLKFNY